MLDLELSDKDKCHSRSISIVSETLLIVSSTDDTICIALAED